MICLRPDPWTSEHNRCRNDSINDLCVTADGTIKAAELPPLRFALLCSGIPQVFFRASDETVRTISTRDMKEAPNDRGSGGST